MQPRLDLNSWSYECIPWVLPLHHFYFPNKNTPVEQSGLHHDSFLHVYDAVCHITFLWPSFLSSHEAPFLTWTSKSFFRDRVPRRKVQGIRDKDDRTGGLSRFCTSDVLSHAGFLKSSASYMLFPGRNGTKSAETIIQHCRRGAQTIPRTLCAQYRQWNEVGFAGTLALSSYGPSPYTRDLRRLGSVQPSTPFLSLNSLPSAFSPL